MQPESIKMRDELLRRRVRDLEQRTRTEIETARPNFPREIFLAKTTDAGVTYPTDPATVYPILFIDGSYTASPGNQTPSFTNHSATNQAVAYSLTTDFLPVGTVVAVFRQDNRWWILPSAGTPSIPPVAGVDVRWQIFNGPTLFSSDQPLEAASNTRRIFLGDAGRLSLPKWVVAEPADDTDLFTVVGPDHADAYGGGLQCVDSGWYAFSFRFIYVQAVDSAAPTPPDPTEHYQVSLTFGLGSIPLATEIRIIDVTETTNGYVSSATPGGPRVFVTGDYFHQIDTGERVNVYLALTNSITPTTNIDIWGYEPRQITAFIKRLD